MIYKKKILVIYIDLFANASVEIIYNMVKDFKTHRCALDLDILFLGLLTKSNKQWNKNHWFLIYNSPRSQDLVMYLSSEDAHKW